MFGFLYTRWGWILTIIALVHFIRRRPNNFWIWVILMGGWIGGLVYFFMEIVPDIGLDQPFRHYFVLRKRIEEAEATVLENPAAGNYEELGLALFDDSQFARARESYDKAITPRTDHIDPFYRRALCNYELGDFNAALPDLERVIKKEPDYDFHRAPGVLAETYAACGRDNEALALFEKTLNLSTLTETQYHHAALLAKCGRTQEAKDHAEMIMQKRKTMRRYFVRRDQKWFDLTKVLLKQIS